MKSYNTSKREQLEVEIDGKPYLLMQLNGENAARYRSAQTECTRISNGQLAEIRGIGQLQPLLVSLALYEVYERSGTKQLRPVVIQTVNSWPDEVVKGLHDDALSINPSLREKESKDTLEKRLRDTQLKLSQLNGHSHESELEEASAKNSQLATTGISE